MECEYVRCCSNGRTTYSLLHISTVYRALHSKLELENKKFILLIYENSTFQHFIHAEQNVLTFHTPYIRTDPVQFELQNTGGP